MTTPTGSVVRGIQGDGKPGNVHVVYRLLRYFVSEPGTQIRIRI